MVNAASRWSASDYAANAGFVPALGAAALSLLDPQPGEMILDIGCGDGALTQQIGVAGAKVIGLDASADMVEAADAQALGLETQLARFGRFDAAFSNAALHWMLDPAAVARGVFSLLRPGGRFVGEMGGEGNLAILRKALREELTEQGYPLPADDPQWYASPGAFASVYADAGFEAIEANLLPRPTPLPTGVTGWIKTFRAGFLELAGVAPEDRDEIAEAVERRVADELRQEDGSFSADYVRLRFKMIKPEQ
jgi:SAM-dependent methyltransferase